MLVQYFFSHSIANKKEKCILNAAWNRLQDCAEFGSCSLKSLGCRCNSQKFHLDRLLCQAYVIKLRKPSGQITCHNNTDQNQTSNQYLVNNYSDDQSLVILKISTLQPRLMNHSHPGFVYCPYVCKP